MTCTSPSGPTTVPTAGSWAPPTHTLTNIYLQEVHLYSGPSLLLPRPLCREEEPEILPRVLFLRGHRQRAGSEPRPLRPQEVQRLLLQGHCLLFPSLLYRQRSDREGLHLGDDVRWIPQLRVRSSPHDSIPLPHRPGQRSEGTEWLRVTEEPAGAGTEVSH